MKYAVYGNVSIGVCITVDADSEEEAIEAAYDEFDGLTGYAGNGGTGKLVGTRQSNVQLDADGEADFTEAEVSK